MTLDLIEAELRALLSGTRLTVDAPSRALREAMHDFGLFPDRTLKLENARIERMPSAVLRVEGDATEPWAVPGISGATLGALHLTLEIAADGREPRCQATLAATLGAGERSFAVRGAAAGPGAWRLAATLDLEDAMALMPDAPQRSFLPPGTEPSAVKPLTDWALVFAFDHPQWTRATWTAELAGAWSVLPGLLVAGPSRIATELCPGDPDGGADSRLVAAVDLDGAGYELSMPLAPAATIHLVLEHRDGSAPLTLARALSLLGLDGAPADELLASLGVDELFPTRLALAVDLAEKRIGAAEIGVRLRVKGLGIDGYLRYPGWIVAGGLARGEVLDARRLAATFLPDASMLPELAVTRFGVEARLAGPPNLDIHARFSGEWKLPLGHTELALTDVDLRLSNFPAATQARLEAWTALGDARCYAHVELPSFAFGAGLQPGAQIDLKRLAADLFGDELALPEGLPAVVVTRLGLQAAPRAGTFELHGAAEIRGEGLVVSIGRTSLALKAVDLRLARTVKSAEGRLGTILDIGGAPFRVEVQMPGAQSLKLQKGHAFALSDTLDRLLPEGLTIPAGVPRLTFDVLEVTLAGRDRASIAASTVEPWPLPFARGLVVRDVAFTAGVEPREGRPVPTATLSGALALGDASMTMKATLGGVGRALTFALRNTDADNPLTLGDLVSSLLPEGIRLPDELPRDVALATLDLTFGTDRSFQVRGEIRDLELPYTLGDARLTLTSAGLDFKRSAEGKIELRVDVEANGRISDDLQLPKLGFHLEYDDGDWDVGGEVSVIAFAEPFSLEAGYKKAGATRQLELLYEHGEAGDEPPRPLIQIPGMASFDVTRLVFSLEKGTGRTAWKVEATANLHVFYQLGDDRHTIFELKEGTLTLFDEKSGRTRTQGLTFTAADARTGKIAIFPHGDRTFGFVARFSDARVLRENGAFRFSATAGLDFHDPPRPFDVVFADSIDGTFAIDGEGARFTIKQLAKDIPIPFPDIPTGGDPIPLGEGVINLRDLGVSLGKDLALTADIVVGLPSKLNNFFGVDRQGAPRHRLLRTWAADGTPEEREESLVRIGFRIGTDGVRGALKSSPLIAFPIEDNHIILDWTDEKDIGTPRDLGRFELEVPTFALDLKQGSLKFSGGFRVDRERGLRIPLTPVKSLLALLAATDARAERPESPLHRLAELLPDSVPVGDISFFDEVTGLRVGALEEFLGIELPAELRRAAEAIKDVADRLPDRFKHYLNLELPTSLRFAIDVTPDGGVRLNLRADERPLKLLVPGGLHLIGVELRGFSFGAALGGALLVADADLRMDGFDLLELAGSVLIPPDLLGDYLPSSRHLRQTIICDELFFIIIYQSGVPIPIPVFFKEVGFSVMTLAGVEAQSRLHFPRPVFKADRALKILTDLIAFFSKPQYYLPLPEGEPREGDLNLVFTIGPQYLGLPRFLGSTERTVAQADYRRRGLPIGFETVRADADARVIRMGHVVGRETDLLQINTLRLLYVLLNAFKKGSPQYLLDNLTRELPLEVRLGFVDVVLFNHVFVDMAWAITTPQEFVTSAAEVLAGRFEKRYQDRNQRSIAASRDTRELLALLPARGAVVSSAAGADVKLSSKDEGLVVFLRGALDVGEVLTLQAAFGLSLTDTTGFGAGLMFSGRLAEVLDLQLMGLVKITPPRTGVPGSGKDVLRIAGKAYLALLRSRVLDGSFELEVLDDGRFEIRMRGMLDLFPRALLPDFPLRIYSGKRSDRVVTDEDRHIVGMFNQDRLHFEGEMHLELGVFQLAGRVRIQSGVFDGLKLNRALISLALMDATLTLEMHQTGDRFVLAGTATPVKALGGLVAITAADGDGGPKAELVVVGERFESFSLTGEVVFLGLKSSALVALSARHAAFTLDNQVHVPGLHGRLALGCEFIPGQRLTAGSNFELRLDLGELLAALIKQVTRVSFPVIHVGTGVRIETKIEAAQAVDEDEAAYRERREAYERRAAERQRLQQEADQAIARAREYRAKLRQQRQDSLQRIRRAEASVAQKQAEIAALEQEIERATAALRALAPGARYDEYEANVSSLRGAIKALGDDIDRHRQIIDSEQEKFKHELGRIQQTLKEIQKQLDDLAAGEDPDRFNELQRARTRLEVERSLYNKKVALIVDAGKTQPAPDNARSALARAERERTELERAVNLDAEYRKVFGDVDQHLLRSGQRSRLDGERERALPVTGRSGRPLDFVEPRPRTSHLSVAVTARLHFIGYELTLPFRMTLDNLERVNWRDHALLADIAAVVLRQLGGNLLSLVFEAAQSFGALARHLLRMIFEPGYRDEQLAKGAQSLGGTITAVPVSAEAEQTVLVRDPATPPAELEALLERQRQIQQIVIARLRDNQSTSPEEIRAHLEQAGWTRDELDVLLPTANPSMTLDGGMGAAS